MEANTAPYTASCILRQSLRCGSPRRRGPSHQGKMQSSVVFVIFLFSQQILFIPTEGSSGKCQMEYTWNATRGNHNQTYHYNVVESQQCLDCTTENVNVKVERPAEMVSFMNYTFYGSKNAGGEGITCLNITFEINRYSASNTKGLLFILENSEGERCFRLNFTTQLDDTSVFDKSTLSRDRRFYFDCFCDIKPSDGPEYKLSIQPIPFRVTDCTLPDDQKLEKTISLPNCKDPIRKWRDKYCPPKTDADDWMPVLPISLTQVFPEFNTLRVTFDIAPHLYGIDHYKVHISHRDTLTGIPKSQMISQEEWRTFEKEVNGSRFNLTSADYTVGPDQMSMGDYITVMIWPCVGDSCMPIIHGPTITFREDPCGRSGVCGLLESCITLSIDSYRCQCVPGAINGTNHTCIVQPKAVGAPAVDPEVNHGFSPAATTASIVVLFGAIAIIALILYKRAFYQRASGCPMKTYSFCRHVLSCLSTPHEPFPEPVPTVPDPLPYQPAGPSAIGPILFAYPEDNDEFVQIVEKLAQLFSEHGHIECILPSQHTVQIGSKGPEVWAAETSSWANKIIWVCSKSAERTLQESSYVRGPGGPAESHGRTAYGNMFRMLARLTQGERETETQRGKHVVCSFSEVSSRSDVPRIFNGLLWFELLQNMESMCCYLLGIEKNDLKYRNSLPYLSGQQSTPERTALVKALERWAEREPGASVQSQAQPLLSANYDSSFHKSVRFLPVNEIEESKMSLIIGFLNTDDHGSSGDDDTLGSDDHSGRSDVSDEDGADEGYTEHVCSVLKVHTNGRPIVSSDMKSENNNLDSSTADTGFSSLNSNNISIRCQPELIRTSDV